MVGKRPWQNQRGKRLRVGCLTEQNAQEGTEWNVGGLEVKASELCSLALGWNDSYRD